jgi:hypothetical protein
MQEIGSSAGMAVRGPTIPEIAEPTDAKKKRQNALASGWEYLLS